MERSDVLSGSTRASAQGRERLHKAQAAPEVAAFPRSEVLECAADFLQAYLDGRYTTITMFGDAPLLRTARLREELRREAQPMRMFVKFNTRAPLTRWQRRKNCIKHYINRCRAARRVLRTGE